MKKYELLHDMAIEYAKEDGIFYEYMNGNVEENEFEDFIENKMLELEQKKDEKIDREELISELYFIGAKAREYAELIRNPTMIKKIVLYCENIEKIIREKNGNV